MSLIRVHLLAEKIPRENIIKKDVCVGIDYHQAMRNWK